MNGHMERYIDRQLCIENCRKLTKIVFRDLLSKGRDLT